MALVLPGSGDSAGGQIIVPGGRKGQITGPTRRIPLSDNELFYKVQQSQSRGYLRHHRDHDHIVGCSDSGFFACLHCQRVVYGMETMDQQRDFVADHANCQVQPVEGAVGVLVVEAGPCSAAQ